MNTHSPPLPLPDAALIARCRHCGNLAADLGLSLCPKADHFLLLHSRTATPLGKFHSIEALHEFLNGWSARGEFLEGQTVNQFHPIP